MGSLITSLTRMNAGGGQRPRVDTYDAKVVATAGVLTQNASHLVLVRVSKPVLVTTAFWYVTVQSGNVNAGIFAFDGTTFTPVAATGSVAAGVVGPQSQPLLAPFTYQPGVDYWTALSADSATFACLRTQLPAASFALDGNECILKVANFPLASFTAPLGSTQMPFVRMK